MGELEIPRVPFEQAILALREIENRVKKKKEKKIIEGDSSRAFRLHFAVESGRVAGAAFRINRP